MPGNPDEGDERIALLLDYENLAIGAREGLGVSPFDLTPVADALAVRGRVVARRAYADWSSFDDDRRLLARAQVELIDIPQRLGGSRKNAADIKMAVDAVEIAYERSWVTTFAIGTGDSDFTPLVHKLRELDKRVIGIGVASSTSRLLPPACDEFLYYDRLLDAAAPPAEPAPATQPEPAADEETAAGPDTPDDEAVGRLVTRTLSGLARRGDGPVLASRLKRAILRQDPTFDEAEHGFRGFGELLRHLQDQRIVELAAGSASGDPEVSFPENEPAEDDAFRLLAQVVGDESRAGGGVPLSGLKDRVRKRRPDFSEKTYGFASFLSFAKAARARGVVRMAWDAAAGDWRLEPA
ncbi:PIN domain-containing protein [Actinomycetospora sp. TBRC 11914]|uniref:PIN domain-containing protein n=1 Tax=Actinomycetospora sp. TBRC 11914 TaxID=2729387 RepID=UPI00145FB052|nr:PIN domain-containing protein [Actinomycetospora sp. TBRC 11914]NMO91025.1 NYN domain-containing protein [Actinomycetospora sp. TBRC 11914]